MIDENIIIFIYLIIYNFFLPFKRDKNMSTQQIKNLIEQINIADNEMFNSLWDIESKNDDDEVQEYLNELDGIKTRIKTRLEKLENFKSKFTERDLKEYNKSLKSYNWNQKKLKQLLKQK